MQIDGLKEFRAAVEAAPARWRAQQRQVAHATAKRIQAGARTRLKNQLKTRRTALIDAIVIEEDATNQAFSVVSHVPAGQPAMVAVWNEYGTVHMGARPYMHPATEAERTQYQRESEATATALLQNIVGGQHD